LWQRNHEVIFVRTIIPKLGQPVWVLLSGVLFTHLGTYMLMPYLSIILSREKHLSLDQVGWVLGSGSLAYLIGSLIGGLIADRLGRKLTMVSGLLIRAGGVLLFLFMQDFTALLLTWFLAGIGGGLYMPPAKAGIAAFTTEETKTTAFSYRGIAANIGVTLGPLLGTMLLARSDAVLFFGAVAVYVGLAIAHFVWLRQDCRPGLDCADAARPPFREILKDRPFLFFSAVTILVWALFTQFTLSLPLRAVQINAAKNIGLIWTITSILVIVLQGPTTRLFAGRLHPLHMMGLGMVIIGSALGSVAFSSSYWHLLGSAILFTLGEMLIMPISDAIVSDLARPEMLGTYFGVSAFVFGAGETIGNIGGGQLMEWASTTGALAVPWLTFAVLGVIIAALFWMLSLWQPLGQPLRPTPTMPTLAEPEDSTPIRLPIRRKQKT
jgi:MFS family permease